jgi:hypothetical protein
MGLVLDAVSWRRRGRGGLRRFPACGVDHAAAGRARRDHGEPRGAAGAFQEGDRLGAEDVGVASQLEERDSRVERGTVRACFRNWL